MIPVADGVSGCHDKFHTIGIELDQEFRFFKKMCADGKRVPTAFEITDLVKEMVASQRLERQNDFDSLDSMIERTS